MGTKFNFIYDCFYSKITDDMYMELDAAQTAALTRDLLLNALPWFEFPRVDLYNYDLKNSCFKVELTNEEINILATYMIVEWLGQQLASIENIRMKYSASDFKFTSQANHIAKLTNLKKDYERVGFHLQRLYKRRKVDSNGVMRSTMRDIMANSVRGGGVSAPSYQPPVDSGGGRPESDPVPGGGGGTEDNEWEDMGTNSDSGSTDSDNSWDDMGNLPSDEGEGSYEEM